MCDQRPAKLVVCDSAEFDSAVSVLHTAEPLPFNCNQTNILNEQCHKIFDPVYFAFFVDVRVVSDYTDMFPRSQRLRWHCIRIVNDYGNRVSEKSMTTLTPCQRSRWLCRHTFFANILAKMKSYAKPLLPVHIYKFRAQVEFFDKKVSKISWHCPFKHKGELFCYKPSIMYVKLI